jgi:integrase/recombinase XerC
MNPAAVTWLSRFFAHLTSERRISEHTLSAYKFDLTTLQTYCDKYSIEAWPQLDSQHLRAYAGSEHRRGIGARSIQRRLSAARTFFNFLLREGELKNNPAVGVQAPKAGKRLPATLDVDQMQKLLHFRADESLDKRDKAIMELFYSSGLRLSELMNAELQDLDMADRTVRVIGKGNKTRIVPVGRYALEAIQAWLKERTLLANTGVTLLFVGRDGNALKPRAVQHRIANWAKKQGLGVHLHPHMFRHSFATHMLESSHDLRGVQELLGHANISTTQVYTHLDFQHLAKIYDAAHPRAKLRKSRDPNTV